MNKLERCLMHVIADNPDISGRQFQEAALKTAEAYFDPADIDEYNQPVELAAALAKALAELPPIEWPGGYSKC